MSKYRTPLRYPGGKQRLAPFVAEILEANDAAGWNYAEPYAGGAGVAMELLLDGVLGHVYLNDSSRPIFAFWSSMLADPDRFCRRISAASLTLKSWHKHREVLRHPDDHDDAELGFSTFFLNRCNHSGALTSGVIGGQAQQGTWKLDARFPRNELIKRIEAICLFADRITVTNMDAERFMRSRVNRLGVKTLTYCDPPYYAKAKRLYLDIYAEADHARLAETIQDDLQRHWIVSYDANPVIADLYGDRRTFTYALHYSAIRAYEGSELFVFSDSLKIPEASKLTGVNAGLQSLWRPA